MHTRKILAVACFVLGFGCAANSGSDDGVPGGTDEQLAPPTGGGGDGTGDQTTNTTDESGGGGTTVGITPINEFETPPPRPDFTDVPIDREPDGYITGNPVCTDIWADTEGFSVTLGPDGTYTSPDGTWSVQVYLVDGIIYWSSSIPLAGVIVKAGNGANYYVPTSSELQGVVTPDNKLLSHLTFCRAVT
jgi:hypothetical protein